jgi:Leucine Rich repeat
MPESRLVRLNLAKSRIGDLGATSIARSIHMSLKAVDLKHNPLGGEGVGGHVFMQIRQF